MSATSTGIPPLIEQQLLALDKQLRDAAFVRGAGRFAIGVCVILGSGLLLDGWLDLNGTIRVAMLIGWIAAATFLLWRVLIRPVFQPVCFSSLAALVEQQFPELRERLTSLVELRGSEATDLAPGASTLMQDLLARQTVKALDRITVEQAASNRGSARAVFLGTISILLLLAPFGWNPEGYGLLWGRFFVPWGNFAWGATLDLKVIEGDQIVARGTDVDVHVALTERRNRRSADKNHVGPLWLNWRDEKGASDSRRLEWDEQSEQFLATLPHLQQSLSFEVTTNGARSGTYRVDVSDPPAVSQLNFEVEPATYTGLPAKTIAGVPADVQVPEFSRIEVVVEFDAPVSTANLIWPTPSEDAAKTPTRADQQSMIEQSIPLDLSSDHRSGSAKVTATLTGQFSVLAKNRFGLQNQERSRRLVVVPDQPPQIKLDVHDEPMLVRPDDVVELSIEVVDDYGLTAVELHAETSAGVKHVESLTADQRRDSHVSHTFALDLTPFVLMGGQAVSYRLRAVDNRPHPNPHEVWTTSRTLVVNTSLKQLPDPQMAAAEKSLEDELASLRMELNENKSDLSELHQQTEREALKKQPESDKSERLDQLLKAQEELVERLQQLSDRLAERRMTQELAPQAQQIAEGDLKTVQDRLKQSKGQESRDQLEPLSQAIDRLGTADRQLRQLEDQLVDLNKLEQDLAELTRMAQHAERLAEQLEKLDAKQQAAMDQDKQPDATQAAQDLAQSSKANADSVAATENKPQTQQQANNPSKSQDKGSSPDDKTASEKAAGAEANSQEGSGIPQKLKDEAQKLADQMSELLKKHPELLDAARRDQVDQLNNLADQARKLAEPQERLAEALQEAAQNAPAVASRPDNVQKPQSEAAQEPAGESKPNSKDDGDGSKPAAENPAAAQKANPGSPEAGASDEKPSGDEKPKPAKLTPEKMSTDKTSQEKSTNEPAGEQSNEKSQKPADATKPSDSLNEQGNPPSASKPGNDQPSADGSPKDAPVNSTKDPQAGENSRAKPATPNEQQTVQQKAQQAGSEATQQQEQISREATKQALDLARETGADSEATRAAADFARKADSAKQKAQTGQLAAAAKEARESAKAAEDTARQLNPDGQSSSPQAKQAQEQADRQNEVAKQLEKLAPSEDAAQGAQLQGQKQLAKVTSQLAEQLERASKSLKSMPLNSPKEAESGERAQQAAKQAEQSMKQAAKANQQNDPQQAAQAASEAAAKLKEAADSVTPSAPKKSNSVPVPKEIGTQIAEVTKRLESAQKDLSQCDCQNPAAAGKSTSSKPGQSQSSSQAGQPQSQQGQNPPTNQSQSQNPQDAKSGQTLQDSKAPGQSPQGGKPQGQGQQESKTGQDPQDAKSQGQSPEGGKPQGQNPQDAKPDQSQPIAKSDGHESANPTAPQQGEAKEQGGAKPQGEAKDGQPVGSQQKQPSSQLAQVVQQFREAAAMLRQARGEARESANPSQAKKSQRPGQPMPNDRTPQSESADSSATASGTMATPDLSHLDAELQQQARRNWGRLPGQLRTEILQGAGKKSHPEYSQRIKSYFEEITKPAK